MSSALHWAEREEPKYHIDYGDQFGSDRWPRARKAHECHQCGGRIERGEQHLSSRFLARLTNADRCRRDAKRRKVVTLRVCSRCAPTPEQRKRERFDLGMKPEDVQIGMPIRFYHVARRPEFTEGRCRGLPRGVRSDDDPSIWIEGVSGSVLLRHCTPASTYPVVEGHHRGEAYRRRLKRNARSRR